MQLHKYTAIAVVTIQAGALLALTAAQAADRRHAIKPVKVDKDTGDGVFEVLAPMQFKVGETIITDLELNKQLADQLETPEGKGARRQKAAKAGEGDDVALLKAKAEALDQLLPHLEALGVKTAADLEAIGKKAAALDNVRADLEAVGVTSPEQLVTLAGKAAAYDSLPEKVRAEAAKASTK